MEFVTINQFESGNRVEGFYMIKAVQCKTTSNNNRFLDLTIGDKTGEINAKLWDCTDDDEKEYTQNIIVKIRGTVVEWQNQLQLKIERIRLAAAEDGVNIADFVPTAPYEPEFMYNQIQSYVSKISNPHIKSITSLILKENKQYLMTYPAAMKNHHSVRSGLLYHIMTMLMLGEKISEIYTFINTDLLYAGIILHDIAKIFEMEAGDLGIVSDYTTEGQLLGHIIQGIKLIDRTARKVGADEEVSMLLQHMILSHHYEPEFGSPKKPMIPEAELLHYIDMIDSRMYDMKKALEATHEGGFSEKLWSLENRRIYKANIYHQKDEKSLA